LIEKAPETKKAGICYVLSWVDLGAATTDNKETLIWPHVRTELDNHIQLADSGI
jgi:hypothetical protein